MLEWIKILTGPVIIAVSIVSGLYVAQQLTDQKLGAMKETQTTILSELKETKEQLVAIQLNRSSLANLEERVAKLFITDDKQTEKIGALQVKIAEIKARLLR